MIPRNERANFGGDSSVDTIQEWTDCQLAAATCDARQQLATVYPRFPRRVTTVTALSVRFAVVP